MSHRRMTDENAREALPDCTLSGPAWLANDGEPRSTVRSMTEETAYLASANVDVIDLRCPAHCGQQG